MNDQLFDVTHSTLFGHLGSEIQKHTCHYIITLNRHRGREREKKKRILEIVQTKKVFIAAAYSFTLNKHT